MTRHLIPLALLSLLSIGACKTTPTEPVETDADTDADADADTDADTDTDTDADSDADTDTDVPLTGEASIAIVQNANGARWIGLFAEDLLGFENAAECWLDDAFCRPDVPIVGAAPVSGVDDFDILAAMPSQIDGLVVGSVPALPPLPNTFAYEGLFPSAPTGPIGVSWSASATWPGFDDPALIPDVAPLQLSEPADGVVLAPGGTIPIRWTPDSTGNAIEIAVVARDPGGAQVRQVIAVDDTGSHDLDVDDLGLTDRDLAVSLEISRVAYGTSVAANNPVQWTHRWSVDRAGWYLGSRQQLESPASCADAQALLAPYGPGSYLGDFGSQELDPGDGSCIGFASPGPEAILPVEIPADTLAVFRARALNGFAKVYGLSDCSSAATCIAGTDATFFWDGAAEWTYLNDTGAPVALYLVIDGDPTASAFELEYTQETPAALDVLADTCAQAEAATPLIAPDQLVGTLEGFAADADPVFAGCGVLSYDGPDAFVPVEVGAGERMLVRATGPVGLHASESCGSSTVCTASVFPGQSLSWANDTAGSVVQYVAADGYSVYADAQSFALDVDVFTPTALTPEDTCATLSNAPQLTTGVHHFEGDLFGLANDDDLANPGPSCTGYESPGEDGLVRVQLQPGETMTVDYVRVGGDGSVYVLETCGDTTTAVACDDNATIFQPGVDAPEKLTVTNTTGAVADWTLVLDAYVAGGLAAPFFLDVTIE